MSKLRKSWFQTTNLLLWPYFEFPKLYRVVICYTVTPNQYNITKLARNKLARKTKSVWKHKCPLQIYPDACDNVWMRKKRENKQRQQLSWEGVLFHSWKSYLILVLFFILFLQIIFNIVVKILVVCSTFLWWLVWWLAVHVSITWVQWPAAAEEVVIRPHYLHHYVHANDHQNNINWTMIQVQI